MRRLHLFEFNDQPWLPTRLRDYMTDYLETLFAKLGVYAPVAPKLAELMKNSGEHRIVDLGSGAGGPLGVLAEPIQEELGEPVDILLTDLFPNLPACERLAAQSGGIVRFSKQPVDMFDIPDALPGVRTSFDAIHHFQLEQVGELLAAAQQKGVSIAVFDSVNRRLPVILSSIFIPVFVWGMTPFIRPFRWSRLLLTYVIPILPLLIFWDGLVSHLRGHRASELAALCARLEAPPGGRWQWETGELPAGPGAVITYALGGPR